LFCPREAISRSQEKVARPFETQTISHNQVNSCQICGSTTAEQDKTLCYWCEQAAASDNELKNSCKKILLRMSN
jgi:RecJ-like exonuclease